jgi:hypothetical protein
MYVLVERGMESFRTRRVESIDTVESGVRDHWQAEMTAELEKDWRGSLYPSKSPKRKRSSPIRPRRV